MVVSEFEGVFLLILCALFGFHTSRLEHGGTTIIVASNSLANNRAASDLQDR